MVRTLLFLFSRFKGSFLAVWGFVAVAIVGVIAWLRRDAKRDLGRKIKEEDQRHAKEISNRVSSDRALRDKRLREFENRGYRD